MTSTISDSEWARKKYLLEVKNSLEGLNGNEEKSWLDIGCGHGNFAKYMQKFNWEALEINPSDEAYQRTTSKGPKLLNGSFEEFYEKSKDIFSFICLNTVIEHVQFPLDTISKCKDMLIDEEILRIKVSNEFNSLQFKANDKVIKKNWWISYPDHIICFSKDSITKAL